MLHQTSISAFASGSVRVGVDLSAAEPLWIEPYTAVAVGSLDAFGGVAIYASFDGNQYYLYDQGVLIEPGLMRSWKARIPARWLKFVGAIANGEAELPDGTILEWGAKS